MSPKKNGKSKTDNGADNGVTLVPQEHGGALNSGGTPGNKGNPDSIGFLLPHSHIRTHCRGSFAERVPVLEAIADGRPLPMTKIVEGESETIEISASIKERVSAIETLGKYGGVDKLALTPEEQPDRTLTPEKLQDYLERLERAKDIKALEKMLTEPKQIGSGE